MRNVIVSVVIPVYNSGKTLRKTIESLLNQNFPKEQYEIILVDDGSTDDSLGTVIDLPSNSKVKFRVVKREVHKGCFSARNAGIRVASGEYIAFIDSDMIADSSWLGNLVESFNDDGVGAVIGKVISVVNVQEVSPTDLIYLGAEDAVGMDPYGARGGTGNICYRRDVLEKIGGFDERFDPKFRGDSDLSIRCIDAGFKILYCSEAVAYHPIKKMRLAQIPKEYFKYHKDVLLYAKHGKKIMNIMLPLTKPIVGPFSVFGFLFIVTIIFALLFPPILFLALLSSLLFYVGIGYKWKKRLSSMVKPPLRLRLKEGVAYCVAYPTIYISRVYGILKYHKVLF